MELLQNSDDLYVLNTLFSVSQSILHILFLPVWVKTHTNTHPHTHAVFLQSSSCSNSNIWIKLWVTDTNVLM